MCPLGAHISWNVIIVNTNEITFLCWNRIVLRKPRVVMMLTLSCLVSSDVVAVTTTGVAIGDKSWHHGLMMPILLSMLSPDFVVMVITGVAGDDKVGIMTTIAFQFLIFGSPRALLISARISPVALSGPGSERPRMASTTLATSPYCPRAISGPLDRLYTAMV